MALITDPDFLTDGYEPLMVEASGLVNPFTRSTSREIIADAYDLLSIPSISSEDLERGKKSLNLLLKSLTNKLFVYTLLTIEDTTTGPTLTPENGTKTVDSVWLVINSEDVPLRKLISREWDEIVNKTTTGQPIAFWFDHSRGYINFYPTPEDSYTVKYRILSHITNVTDVDALIDVPRGGELMLVYHLAALLAPGVGKKSEQSGLYNLGEIEKRDFLASQSESWGKYLTGQSPKGIV